MKIKGRRVLRWLPALILAIIAILYIGIDLASEYLWLDSLGYASVMVTRVTSKSILFLVVSIPLAFAIYRFASHLIKDYQKNTSTIIDGIRAKKIAMLLSFSVAGLMAYAFSNGVWLSFLKFTNGQPFNTADPIFGQDIGFYLFSLPFIRQSAYFLFTFLTLMVGTSVLYQLYSIRPKEEQSERIAFNLSNVDFKNAFLTPWLKRTKWLLGAWFVMLGIIYFLRGYQLLQTPGSLVFGAGYTDVNVTLLAYRIYAAIAVFTAVSIIAFSGVKRMKWLAIGPIALIVATVAFSTMTLFVQKLVVEPDEINKELTYLSYNMAHTKDAYNIKAVEKKDYLYEETLTLEKLMRNEETVKNIRVNDARPMLQTFNQIQSIRLYYDFVDVNIDRYTIDGKYTQVFITPRELNQQKLDSQAKTWVNEYLKFTHGYGVVISPVNRVTQEGQPELLMRNIPPITSTDLTITRPEIYFGEITNRYVLVKTNEKEFDYPSGQDNVESIYEGADGVPLRGLNRLIYAIKQRSMKLLVSNNITPESRILLNRNIVTRVKAIAPFLTYDGSPYIVLNQSDGKLYWIIDAYTTSNQYPYSELSSFRGGDVSYVRNSVKVVIDAYEGTTSFYVYDDNDPVIQTYAAIYPKVFKSKTEMPEGLVAHVRYPLDYFDVQSRILRKYHVNNPVVFYNGEDLWDIAQEKYMGTVQSMEPNYVMFKINDKAEFTLILPYTPRSKPNMTALLVARNDGPYYGQMFIYAMPKDQTIQGPIMIESRIDQDAYISQEFTLWGQQGSTILRGNVIVVPIENSLLYVEPIYLQSDNQNSLPEMKRVIVAYKNEIVMEQTLDIALMRLFGAYQPEESENETLEQLLDQIRVEFEKAKLSLEELEKLIEALSGLVE